MPIKAKEIVDGKFWILEDNGEKVATLSLSDEKFLLSDSKGTRFFDKEDEISSDIGLPAHDTRGATKPDDLKEFKRKMRIWLCGA